RSFPATVSFSSAMAKRPCSCATEAAHNGSILSSSGFSSRKIRQRVSRARIVQDGLLQVLVLPEARWKKPIGTTLQRNDSQTRSPTHSITMLTPTSSPAPSSSLPPTHRARDAKLNQRSTEQLARPLKGTSRPAEDKPGVGHEAKLDTGEPDLEPIRCRGSSR